MDNLFGRPAVKTRDPLGLAQAKADIDKFRDINSPSEKDIVTESRDRRLLLADEAFEVSGQWIKKRFGNNITEREVNLRLFLFKVFLSNSLGLGKETDTMY